MRCILQSLVILALVFSAASPACKFISGKANILEICAADGSLKQIPMPEGYKSPLPEKPERKNHSAKDSCAFCFAAAHAKPLASGRIAVSFPAQHLNAEIQIAYYKDVFAARAELAGIETRPPPRAA